MMRLITLLLFAVLAGMAGPPCFAAAPAPLVRVGGSSFSLDVKDQPLTTILDEFTRAGIRIRIDPRINPRITASFENRPIGSGLESILRSFDFALVWAKKDGPGAEEPSLREIQIFKKGQTGEGLPLYGTTNLEVEQDATGFFYVKDTLLVRFDSAMSLSERRDLLNSAGAILVDESKTLGIMRLRLPAGSNVLAIAAILERNQGVLSVEPDYAYSLADSHPVAGDFYSVADEPRSIAGSTIVAVLDSGLSADYADSRFVAGAYDAVSSTALTGDPLGHGTQMVLIAAGTVIPFGGNQDTGDGSTPVVAVRAFDDNGFTSDFTLLRGIDYAVQKRGKSSQYELGNRAEQSLHGRGDDLCLGAGDYRRGGCRQFTLRKSHLPRSLPECYRCWRLDAGRQHMVTIKLWFFCFRLRAGTGCSAGGFGRCPRYLRRHFNCHCLYCPADCGNS